MSIFQNKNDLLLNINNPHNLIPKNTSITNRKELNYFSFNSNDRDIRLYPNTNFFTFKLPVTLSNITSLSLFSIFFTGPIYNFSKNLGNNSFKIGKYDENVSRDINLVDGNYNITSILNYINQLLEEKNLDIRLEYLRSQNRFVFISNSAVKNQNSNRFYIQVDSEYNNCNYTNNSNDIKDILYSLGFEVNRNYNRIDSTFTSNIRNIIFLFKENIINNQNWHNVKDNDGRFFALAQNPPRFRSEEPIFFEIEKFNTNINECRFNSDNSGSILSAFAKINADNYNSSSLQRFTSGRVNGIVDNVTKNFLQPINHISNLQFKFRYGDNILVDLQNTSVDFTIAIRLLEEAII